MKPTVHLEYGPTGVRRQWSEPKTISEANEQALLMARTAFEVRMLHEKLTGESSDPIKEVMPQIFVPRFLADPNGGIEQIDLGLAAPVESITVASIPDWLIAALKKAQPDHSWWKTADELDGGIEEVAWTMLFNIYQTFLDHAGLVRDQRGVVLVSEPYTLSVDQLGTLFQFVADADLNLQLNGVSNHAPSHTFRIEIWSKKKE